MEHKCLHNLSLGGIVVEVLKRRSGNKKGGKFHLLSPNIFHHPRGAGLKNQFYFSHCALFFFFIQYSKNAPLFALSLAERGPNITYYGVAF